MLVNPMIPRLIIGILVTEMESVKRMTSCCYSRIRVVKDEKTELAIDLVNSLRMAAVVDAEGYRPISFVLKGSNVHSPGRAGRLNDRVEAVAVIPPGTSSSPPNYNETLFSTLSTPCYRSRST
jgi:hypothetical protein